MAVEMGEAMPQAEGAPRAVQPQADEPRDNEPQVIVVGATGASGMPILCKCLELIAADPRFESELIMSDAAKLTLSVETDLTVRQVESMATRVYDIDQMDAPPASGTHRTAGMVVVPCSMKTVAGINNGYSQNLLLRAADVTLKEQRRLVLCSRETPMSAIHLRNLHELAMVPGVMVVPPMISFYHKPQNIDQMVYHIASKLLDPFGVSTPDYRRWE